jgi:flagellar basal body-associated protein FliL
MTDPVQLQPAQTEPEAEMAPVPPKPKKTAVVVLAVLVVLLLGAAGTFGALWISEKNGHAAEKNRSADLSKQLEEKQRSLTAQTMLAQSNLEEMRKSDAAAAASAKCSEAARAVTQAGLTGDQNKVAAAVLNMMSKC